MGTKTRETNSSILAKINLGIVLSLLAKTWEKELNKKQIIKTTSQTT